MTDFSNSVIGVTGAAGQLGRAVIGYLQQRGAKTIVAVTRDPAKLGDLRGVEVRAGDFTDARSLDRAFAGIERLLIISTGEVGIPGGRYPLHNAAIDAAERAGVKHIAYTSITNPYPSTTALVANDHFWTEVRMFSFRGTWTALRDNIYTDMLLQSAPRAIASGRLVHASGDGIRAFVTRDDVAATAAGVLLGAEGNEVLEVSGEPVTFAKVADELGRAVGKPIVPVAITPDELVAGMVSGGLPRHLALAYAAFDADTARNLFAVTGDAVRRFGGREPTTLRQFLAGQTLSAQSALPLQ